MKQKIILLFCFLAFSSVTLIGQETETSIIATISISGMACQEGCADKIAENLKNIEGINSASVSYSSGEAIVNYNENVVAIDEIKKVITATKVKDYVYTIKEVTLKK